MASSEPLVSSSINRKALYILIGLGFLLVLGAVGLRLTSASRERRGALNEAQRLADANRYDLASRHLARYLDLHPRDSVVMTRQAELLDQLFHLHGTIGIDDALSAIRLNERLQKLVSGTRRDAVERRLALLYILYSDALYKTEFYQVMSDSLAKELRYGAAEEIARNLAENYPKDAEAHRLLAMARQGQAVPGDKNALAEAILEYRAALAADPGDVESAFRLARLYRDREPTLLQSLANIPKEPGNSRNGPPRYPELKDLQDVDLRRKAVEVLDTLLKARPKDSQIRLVRYQYFRESRRDTALADAELQAALQLDPSSSWVRLAAAELAARRNKLDEAREHLKAIKADEQSDTAFRAKVVEGLVEFVAERPEEAIDQWRRGLIQLHGTHAELNWWMAYVQLRRGQPLEADVYVKAYGRLSGDQNNDPSYQFLKAVELEQGGNPGEALDALDRIRPASGSYLIEEIALARGRCYEAQGNVDAALEAYRQAEQAAPDSVMPKLAIAALELSRSPEEALTALRQSLRENPGDPEILVALAQAQLLLIASLPPGDPRERSFDELDSLLDQLTKVAPENTAIDLLRADRFTLDDQLDKTLELLEHATQQRPQDRRLWAAWAEALVADGQVSRALEVLERGARPEAAGDNAVLRLVRARILVSMARGREAQAALVTGIDKLNPVDQRTTLWEALGRLRSAQGDLDGAREAYNAWAKTAPDSPKPRLALLQLALKLNDRVAAQHQLEVLGRIEPGIPERPDPSRSRGGTPEIIESTSPTYQLAKALILYTFSDPGSRSLSSAQRRAASQDLTKALDIVENLIKGRGGNPDPAVFALRGRIRERQAQGDPAILDLAIKDYLLAWNRRIEEVFPRLLDLLARTKRFDEIEKLRRPDSSAQAKGLSAMALIGAGAREQGNTLLKSYADELTDDPARRDVFRSRILEMAGQFDVVEAQLRNLAESRSRDPLPWLALIAAQAQHGRSAETIEESIAALDNVGNPRPELLKAEGRRAAQQWPAADRAFERAISIYADDPVALATIADYYDSTGRADRALALFRDALKLPKSPRSIARQYAVVLSGKLDAASWEEAWSLVRPDKNLANEPEDRLAQAILLARHPREARRAEAIPLLTQLLTDLDPSSNTAAAARDYLVRLLLATGQAERAIPYAAVSAELAGLAPQMVLHAECLIAAGRLTAAEIELDRLFLFNPLAPDEARLRAKLLAERAGPAAAPAALAAAVANRGNGPSAIALARAVFPLMIESGPPSPPSQATLDVAEKMSRDLMTNEPGLGWMIGRVQTLRGQPAAAMEPCLEAAAAPNTLETDRVEAGRAAMAAAEAAGWDPPTLERAEAVLDAALQYSPHSLPLLGMRSMAHHVAAQYAREAEDYRRILEFCPTGTTEADQVTNNLAWILSEQLERPAEALPMIEELIQRRGSEVSFLCTRGVIYLRLGKAEEAIADLSQVVRDAPNARRLFHLARAYRATGRDQLLREQLERLRQSGASAADVDPAERAEFQALLEL